jgi:hypothetical protein
MIFVNLGFSKLMLSLLARELVGISLVVLFTSITEARLLLGVEHVSTLLGSFLLAHRLVADDVLA